MKSQFRGLVLVITVLLLCAVLGAIYGPNVRATSSSADDYQSAVHDFTRSGHAAAEGLYHGLVSEAHGVLEDRTLKLLKNLLPNSGDSEVSTALRKPV